MNGFKRGSKSLGVPTANVEMNESNLTLINDLVPGVYMANCHLNNVCYKAAVSVGWNPVFDNL